MESARTLREVLWPEIEAVVKRNPPPLGERPLFIIFRNNRQGFAAQDCEDLTGSRRRGVAARLERKIISAIDDAFASIEAGDPREHVLQRLNQHLTAKFERWIQVADTVDQLGSWIDKAERLGDTSGHASGQKGLIVVETYFAD